MSGDDAIPKHFDVRLRALGDRAVIAELGLVTEAGFELASTGSDTTRAVNALAARISAAGRDGVVDLVPAYRSVLIIHDPERLTVEDLAPIVGTDVIVTDDDCAARLVTIPVVYGGHAGPDLEDVARHTGLTADEVVSRHAGADYSVAFLGFTPGFAFLQGLPPELATPRLSTPRTAIPAGSVAIGGAQTAVYPRVSPGGWRLIGRTPIPLFDPTRADPGLLRANDRVRFCSVTPGEFEEIAEQVAAGTWVPEVEHDEGSAAAADECCRGSGSPAFLVLDGGPQTTVQDMGRHGVGRLGISPNGVLDRGAAAWANALVGNAAGAAVLEITSTGPTMRVLRDVVIALGGDFRLLVGGIEQQPATATWVRRDDVVSIVPGPAGGGVRAWLAVAGGFDVPCRLGSRSTDLAAGLGGFQGRALGADDRLPVGLTAGGVPAFLIGPRRERPAGDVEIRVLAGPNLDMLDEAGRARLFGGAYTVSPDSDRMGLRLLGEAIRVEHASSLASEGVVTGTVQLPPDGQPIILLAGRATIGGYPKPACVIDADLDVLSSLPPGATIRFRDVSPAEARGAGEAYRRAMRLLDPRVSRRIAGLAGVEDEWQVAPAAGGRPSVLDLAVGAVDHDSAPAAAAGDAALADLAVQDVTDTPRHVPLRSPAVGRFRHRIVADADTGAMLPEGTMIGQVDTLGVLTRVDMPVTGRLTTLRVHDGEGVAWGQVIAEIAPVDEGDGGAPR